MTNRREFLTLSALSAVALSATHIPFVHAADAPQKRWEAKKFSPEQFGPWPSDVDQHIALYEGYVKKANQILDLLEKASREPDAQSTSYSELRELKVEYSFTVGGIKNHEIYFGHLLGAPRDSNLPKGALRDAITDSFGSTSHWEADLRATGLCARGWVWLAYDLDRQTLFNYLGDAQNEYPIWNAAPLLALDMYEHAFFKDYGRNRGAYIGDFLKRVNWDIVEQSFHIAKKRSALK